ncbi:MAG: ribonuclease Z [Bacteroidia bacterium]|nr:ribonuclease Z [Bacteroidia bacterium]
MSNFEVRIFGTGSAIPTNSRLPSSQIVTINDRHYLVDCGEGTQIQLIRNRIKFSRLDAIFISHMHGDHVLGVPGLLNSLSMYERTHPLKIFAPAGLKDVLDVIFAQTHSYLTYELEFFPLEDYKPGAVIYKTDKFEVSSLPLEHRVFCRGFLFREVNKKPKFDFYKAKALGVPNNYFKLLKQGNTIQLADGREILPDMVLGEAEPPMSYAYCSDTRFVEKLVPYIKRSMLLYHESTFLHDMKSRADETYHSTAKEAATLAKMAEVKHLLLGHFSARYRDLTPFMEEAKEIFSNVQIAREGQVLKLKELTESNE